MSKLDSGLGTRVIVAIDQYSEAATGNRKYFLTKPQSIGRSRGRHSLTSSRPANETFVVGLIFGRPLVVEVVGLAANVLKRVVRIVVGGGTSGTAFTMEVDDRH